MPNANTAAYGTGGQTYPGAQDPNGSEGYMSGNNYGYPSTAAASYHTSSSNNEVASMSVHHAHAAVSSQTNQQHYYGDVHHHQQQHHQEQDAYAGHQTASMQSGATLDYHRQNNKCHPNAAYYDQQQQQQTNSQLHVHQGGEASSIPASYVSSPDPFPAVPGIAPTATAIAAATAAVITPPGTIGQNDPTATHDAYGSFNTYYGTDSVTQPQTQTQADNSNSSSDFNFLSNLANDFAPEYYQLS